MQAIRHQLRRWGRHPYAARCFVISLLLLFICGNVMGFTVADHVEGYDGYSDLLAGAVVFGTMYAWMAAQVIFHCAWSALCDWRGSWRILASLVAACLLYFSVVWTLQALNPGVWSFGDTLLGLLALPALLIVGQTPLWMLRAGWRWEIVSFGKRRRSGFRRPLSVAGLMLTTAAVAVAITSLRIGDQLQVLDLEFVLIFAIAIIVVMVFAAVPALFLLLWADRFRWGWFLSVIFAALLPLGVAVVIGVVAFVTGDAPEGEFWLFYSAVSVGWVTGFACFVSTPLLVARWMGARLQRGGRRGDEVDTLVTSPPD